MGIENADLPCTGVFLGNSVEKPFFLLYHAHVWGHR